MRRNTVEEIHFAMEMADDVYGKDSDLWGSIIYPVADAIRRTVKSPEQVIALSQSLITRLNDRIFHSSYFAEKPLDFLSGGEQGYINLVKQMISELGLPDISEYQDVDPVVAAMTFDLVTASTASLFRLHLGGEIETVAEHKLPIKVEAEIEGEVQTIELPWVIFASKLLERNAKLTGVRKNGRLVIFDKISTKAAKRYMASSQFQDMEETLEVARNFDPVAKIGTENLSTVLLVEGKHGASYVSSLLGKGRGILIRVISDNDQKILESAEDERPSLISLIRLLGDEIRFRSADIAVNIFLIEAMITKTYSEMVRKGLITDENIARSINFEMASLTEYLLSHHGGASVTGSYKKLEDSLDRGLSDHREIWRVASEVVIEWAQEVGLVEAGPDYNFDESHALSEKLWEEWDKVYLSRRVLIPGKDDKPRRLRLYIPD